MRGPGDWCSLCKKPFEHNSRTYGGITADGRVALVGDCCNSHIAKIVTKGFFLSRQDHEYDFLNPKPASKIAKPVSSDEIEKAVEVFRSRVVEADEFLDDMASHGDLNEIDLKFQSTPTPWKDDDAEWFRSHPDRSHHVRDPFPGEFDEFREDASLINKMVIRQVKPGGRVRFPIQLRRGPRWTPNIEFEFDEAVSHALFDCILKFNKSGEPIRWEEMITLAERYAKTSST